MVDSVQVFPPGFRVQDTSGVPVSGALIKFYNAGTTTAKPVYSDAGLTTSLGSVVTCDAAGAPTSDGSAKTLIYTGTASYKVRTTTSADVDIFPAFDTVKGSIDTSAIVALYSSYGSIASAGTTNLGTVAASTISVTGTTTITSLGTTANLRRTLIFSGALTLTHDATALRLPGGANITTSANDVADFISDVSGNWICTNYQRAIVPPLNSSNYAPDIIVEDQKTSGTDGGSSTSGARETRVLNTLVRNNNSIAALASNDVTLPSGSYYAKWSVPCGGGTAAFGFGSYLRNATDSTDLGVGSSEFLIGGAGSSLSQTRSMGACYFTISSSKAIRVQHRVGVSTASNGNGHAKGFTDGVEVYAQLEIWKVV